MNKEIYTVIGLGKTGLSCIEFLTQKGLDVFACDTRETPPNLEEARKFLTDDRICLGELNPVFFEKSDVIILSPGVSRSETLIAEQIKKAKPVIGDVELFCQIAKAPIIAITGTNGKSSVTTLVGEMARCAGVDVKVGGNLGTPVLELLSGAEPELYVLELSSFQLEWTNSLSAEVAVILNITPDHLDQHGTFENYKNAKYRIYNNCKNVVVNLDDPHACCAADNWVLDSGFRLNDETPTPRHPGLQSSETRMELIRDLHDVADVPIKTYSIKQQADFHLKKVDGQFFLCQNDTPLLSVKELKIKGMHQYSNALAALAIGSFVNLPVEAMCKALKEFEGLPHRCQLISNKNDVLWFNDSKATTVEAAIASVKSVASEISGKIILLAGGQGKQQDFSALKSTVNFLKTAILFGEDSDLLSKVLEGYTEICHVLMLDEAVKKANQIAKPGDAVLLAPACASLDMFKNFEHRGDCFSELVRNLS